MLVRQATACTYRVVYGADGKAKGQFCAEFSAALLLQCLILQH